MRIRQAVADDFALLPHIEHRADEIYDRYPGFEDLQNQTGIAPGDIDALADGAVVFVAEVDGEIVGFIYGAPLDDCLFVGQLSVVPEAQKRGIGARLLTAMEDEARHLKLNGVTLITYGHLPFNAPFYAARGFHSLSAVEMGPALTRAFAADTSRWGRYGPRVAMGLRFAD